MNNWKTQLEPVEVSEVLRTVEEAKPSFPMRRIAYPSITLVDDGQALEGQVIRVRTDSLSIGRSEGDLTFPLESLMSGLHCRITLEHVENQQHRWSIEDLNSRHGTYMRCQELTLIPGMEFLAGGTRFLLHGSNRLRMSPHTSAVTYYESGTDLAHKFDELEICSYAVNHTSTLLPLDGRRLQLGRLTHPFLNADPFLEPTHFSLAKIQEGAWKVVDMKTQNGVWVRIRSTYLASTTQITIGEQRLIFQLPVYQ